MASGHLEIETKYDVDEVFELPALTGLDGVAGVDPPVEHELEAVYHDTADLRLLRARVTLRRRTGGSDAGWHLKLPAGTARRELHAPLGRSVKNPPKVLGAPVVGLLRGAPTAPVATLRTRRVVTALRDAEGRLLAEVADDRVTATVPAAGPDRPDEAHTWREVEVELGDGTVELGAAVGTA
ncbi:CYTH domain-containing protein [Blastococcus brunescens]|uniref:CYTH domain-containing protein n=1 Tax=Blastococcus brunescens TaxID=1564165 RepID=A0ABZ1AZ61_9ACTN|nr:CYTH domain-containing protein [Blastococcus sp. BMG 8361]WRL63855.1 CYTH domain-containing protein [Blastococcus sp. BMG 8361]